MDDNSQIIMLIAAGVGAFFLLIVLFASAYTVDQQTHAIVERFGRFTKIAPPGLHFRVPFIDQVVGRVTMRVRQLIVNINTKTKDNVFVDLELAVQYQVRDENDVWNAFYRLSNHEQQMESFIYDTVRAKVPTMGLDEVFENKDDIADSVKATLANQMQEYGFSIANSLVNDVRPAANVAAAMNEIVAQERLRAAAAHRAEADKILVVKAAEADAEAKELAGKGIANQRKAIVEGYRDSVATLQQATGVDAREVMSVVLTTQYFDALRDMAQGSGHSVVFANHAPGEIGNVQQQFLQALISAESVGVPPPDARR